MKTTTRDIGHSIVTEYSRDGSVAVRLCSGSPAKPHPHIMYQVGKCPVCAAAVSGVLDYQERSAD